MSDDATAEPSTGRLVLVTGAGRSGTSTIAGALHHLGLHVPLPVIKPNESNPLGFFESKWPLRFHRRIMERAFVEQTDGRPEAQQLMADAVDEAIRDELRTWLADVALVERQVVVKDPRSIWVPWLWQETAVALGYDVGFLTMLRHPAEVLGSRSTYYRGYRPGMNDWQFSVMNLCGWINGNLVVERQTRGDQRVVLRYNDLVSDWRPCLERVRDTFDLVLDDDLQPGHHHEVDDFIDPGLRRHEPSWEGWDLPPDLVAIAQDVHDAMGTLADKGGHDEQAQAVLDGVAARYEDLVRVSQAIAHDTALSRGKSMTAGLTAELEQARERIRSLESRPVEVPAPIYRQVWRRVQARLDARSGR
ncbi:MAG: hypothetical protein JF565_11420 [Propionibacteriales bacterium]|nr:hypothetical protein [Propionibacteriales bacterium]